MAYSGSAFRTEYGGVLALASGMFVLYGALSLPQGWIAARIGRKRLLTIYFLGTGLSLVICGFATTPRLLGAALAATGGSAATSHPIGTAMLPSNARRRGGMIGLAFHRGCASATSAA